MISVWRWLRAWLSNQTTLALLVVDLESRSDRLTAELRRRDAHHDAELARLRDENAGLRREAEAMDAANQELIRQNRLERLHGNKLAHRISAVHQFAEQLPTEQAAQLRDLLSPKLPGPEATHAHL